MTPLVSHDLLKTILSETGVSESGTITRVLKGDFKRFDFQVKKNQELDFSFLTQGLDALKLALTEDWKANYLEGIEVTRDIENLIFLSKYQLKAESFCVQFKSVLTKDSFFVYFSAETFYHFFNTYMGGAGVEKAQSKRALTEIEKILFTQIAEGLRGLVDSSFSYLDKLDLKLKELNLSDEEQYKEFENKHLVTEFQFDVNKKSYKIALAIPSSFLEIQKEKMAQKESAQVNKKDPQWQQAITSAFLDTSIDLNVSLGSVVIPFEKSVSLKVGDIFVWDKQNPDVTIYQKDRARIHGTLGVVDGNFAVRVSEMVKK